MTTTGVVEIPVDASEFTRFAAAFEDYHDKLKGMPADWQAVNSRLVELAKLQRAAGVSSDAAWKNATTAVVAYEKGLHGAAKAQANLGSTTARTGTAMGRMAAHAKSVKDHLFGAVRLLARFSAFGIGGGLLGAGGLMFGLDDIAGRVLATQRTSRGLGLTSGQYNSFLTNAKRYAGVGALQGAANVNVDPRSAAALSTLGLSYTALRGQNATAITGQEMLAIHRDYARDPSKLSAWWSAANAQGFSDSEIRNIGTARTSSLLATTSAVARDAGSMGFSAQVAREWSAFDIQLAKARVMIGSAFITALTPIVPQLSKLSKEFADFIIGAEKSGEVKKWIDALAVDLKDFATFIGSSQFRSDMRTFAASIGQLARETVHALRWLGLIPGQPAPHPGAAALNGAHTPPGKNVSGLAQYWTSMGGVPASDVDAATKAYSAKYGIPLDLLRRQAKQESGYGTNLYNPKSGEVGVMQVSASNYKALGITNPLSTRQDVRGGAAYDAAMFKKYGSWRKALAAYDWGPGNLDKDIAAHGKDWFRFAPAETQKYVTTIMSPHDAGRHTGAVSAFSAPPVVHSPVGGSSARGGWSDVARTLKRLHTAQQRVHVTVQSPPGSRVYVSANGASGGGGGGV